MLNCFQNKFYYADGVAFNVYSYQAALAEEAAK